ncbi:succinate dehydrogenase, hydrophobic membrane anchor protein [Algiphilus aromaticivorans]|uniref:succinate dehydrogenase, hydrophobic membrane anchor protein n=1 Tax=Algiphilus aromaticivorans TaxID=382454 RepID=UPI0005C1D106|nr:succinate dehydrogenase, hydrophobic membrane anchor protein [Algiphilus aromaticivorans]
MSRPEMQTPLARARGAGSAHHGAHHWCAQRVSAVALLPLSLWFLGVLLQLIPADHAAFERWIGAMPNRVLLAALLLALFHHLALGLQTVAEDYLHRADLKTAMVIGIQLGCALLAMTGLLALL